MANEYQLIETPLQIFDRSEGAFVHSSGEAIDQRLSLQILTKFRELEFQTTKLKREPNGQTLKQFYDQNIQTLVNSYPLEERKTVYSIYNYFKNYMSFHAGDDIELVSAWGYGAYNEIPNDILVKGGYGQIVDRIADQIGKQNILLNHEVIQIDWHSLPINVHLKINSEKHEILRANYVLITTSLGVLKANHKQLFVPQLPQSKAEAIERMGFGRVGKIFLYYSNPFWSKGTLQNLKFARDDQQLDPCSHLRDWTIRVNGFEEVANNPNVIQAWVSGQQTIDLELTDSKEVIERCTDLLRQFTGDLSLAPPDSILSTSWCTNRFIGGSYSYPTTKTLQNDHKIIGEPLPSWSEPKLLFAGEATHESYFSTVHGARLTGLTQANHIIQAINP